MRRSNDQAFAAGLGAWFGLSALLQLNDPDPVGWFAFYAAAALVSLLGPGRPWVRRGGLVLTIVAVAWALRLVAAGLGPTTVGELVDVTAMKTESTELWREALGLLLSAGLLAWDWARARRDGLRWLG